MLLLNLALVHDSDWKEIICPGVSFSLITRFSFFQSPSQPRSTDVSRNMKCGVMWGVKRLDRRKGEDSALSQTVYVSEYPWTFSMTWMFYAATKPRTNLTSEVDSTDVAEQLLPIDVVGHARAEARVAIAEIPVHAVESVCHGVDGIHHKLNLPLLFIVGITADLFQACKKFRRNKFIKCRKESHLKCRGFHLGCISGKSRDWEEIAEQNCQSLAQGEVQESWRKKNTTWK